MQGPLRHGRFFVWVCRQVHEGTQMAFTGSTMPRRDVFFAGTQSDLIPFNMSRSSNVRKFSRRVFRFQYIFSRQNKLVFPHRASKKITRLSHFESTFWRYAGLVAGIHCLGEDLAFFPPRRFFSTTLIVCICSENAVHIGGFYFVRLANYKRRVLDFIALFAFSLLSNAR